MTMTIPVVDAHTHVFSPEMIQGRAGTVGQDPWFALLYAEPVARMSSVDELLHSMDAAGIAQSVICGFPWRDLALCQAHNDYMAAVTAASKDRLAWLATVPPAAGTAAAAEAERCLALGAAGLGELNADAQTFDLTDPATLAGIADLCIANDVPLMLHASEPLGHAYPGKGTATPDRLVTFLLAYPELRVVLAHWGGGLPFYELMPEVAAATKRVVYDSAASTYLYRPQIFRAVLGIVGPDRVLFASDYPVLRQDRFLRKVRSAANLQPGELAPVFGENARRVYRFPAPPDLALVNRLTGDAS